MPDLDPRGIGPTITIPKHCTQCDVDCLACADGQPHMNAAPFDGDTSNLEAVREHNMAGSMHILWDGVQNVRAECGSAEGDRMTLANIRARFYADPSAKSASANVRQVGGSHYSGYPLQHWDLVVIFDWDYFQGQITKYLMRWKKKNGIQDLEKAAHFLEKYIEVEKAKLGQVTKEGIAGGGGGSWSGTASASGGTGGVSR